MSDTKQIDDGGPAFPCSDINDDLTYPRGMSLRDWFAGQALAGRLIAEDAPTEHVPIYAYEIADAMLAARNKKE